MRIALTIDPELPVPPIHYGGIERVVDLLAQELVSMGHHVTLFANPHSTCPVDICGWPGAESGAWGDAIRNCYMLTREIRRGHYDIVHSCSRLGYLLPIMPLRIPKIMNYHRRISRRTTAWMHKVSLGTLEFSAVGRWMTEGTDLPGTWHVVPNCVPVTKYDANLLVPSDAPLIFLGRVEEIKGPHIAIEVAQRSKRRLLIAGNVDPEHKKWFEQFVRPHIDGDQIRYVGMVDDAAKNKLLRSASALLMPILWDEPFGLVMAEAMACGTPVIAFRRGATPEVVAHNMTGFVVDTIDDMIRCVNQLASLSRAECRKRVELIYSETAVAQKYCEIYENLIARVRYGNLAPL